MNEPDAGVLSIIIKVQQRQCWRGLCRSREGNNSGERLL